MSRSSRHKENHGKSSGIKNDYYHDGTAARTRPLSFDEIMSKRKDKQKLFDENERVAEDILGDGRTDGVLERGSGRSKDERAEVVSGRGNRRRKDENTENSDRGNRGSKDENTEKVSDRGNRRSKDECTEKVSDRGNRRCKDEKTEKVSDRGNRRSKYESMEKISNRGSRRSKDENMEKNSDRGDRRSKNENMEKASDRGNRRSKDENMEKVSDRGNRRSKDESAEKVLERGNKQSKDGNTEKGSERSNTRSKDGSTYKFSEGGNGRSKDGNAENDSERGNGRSKDGNTERVSERGNGQSKDGNTERVSEKGNARSKDGNMEIVSERGSGQSRHGNMEIIWERGSGRSKYSSYRVQKCLSERDAKGSSKKKEENISMKDDYLTKSKDKDSETKLKAKIDRDLKPKHKTEVNIHDRRKSNERQSNNSTNEASKKHPRHLAERDRHVDGSRGDSEREDKRKYQNGIDENPRDWYPTRKHDLGKDHDSETLDKKESRDLSKSHHESRRSRSRECMDRKRRSISPLPRSQKRTSYHGRELGEPSSHSLKGKSGQQHSDVDRSQNMNNGSSGHYKRHGGSTSGLGGYSPRKRRTEAAARTPSPINHSQDKKKAKWDLAPERADSTFSVSVSPIFQLSNQIASSVALETVSAVPVASIPVKPFSGVSSSILLTKKKADSIDSVQLTQATRPMRRLYVENIPSAASEKAVMECLNNLLISSGVNRIQGTQPCISCIIHKEKGQALVEFLTPEDASAALSFDGSYFSGSTIKIRRPKDFVEMATGEPEKSVATLNAIRNTAKDSPHKIFIGGISKALSSEMIMEIASTFGPLKAYQFEHSDDVNGPCAFVEYADQSVTSKACAGLNGMKLGGQVISVVQVIPTGSASENDGKPPFSVVPEQAKPLLDKPTQVLKLINVFDPETFPSLSHTEIEEVLEDVRLECARFGNVKSVNVVQNDSIPISTSEACKTNEDMDSAGPQQNLRCDETNAETEKIIEALDHKPVAGNGTGNDKPVEGNGVGDDKPADDLMEDDKPAVDLMEDDKPVDNLMGDDKPVDNLMEDDKPADDLMEDDESCQPGQVDSNMPVGNLFGNDVSESQDPPQETSEDESDSPQRKVSDDIQTKDTITEHKLPVKQELNLEKVNGEIKEAFVSDHAVEADSTGKGDLKEHNFDIGHIFYPSSVFVEFGRKEASCAAAHCLHGRLFDDRTVSVEYIPHDVYRSRFPK